MLRIEGIFGSGEFSGQTIHEHTMQDLVSGSACVAHGQYVPDTMMQLTCKDLVRLADQSPEPY